VRAEAVRLMERAVMLTAPVWPVPTRNSLTFACFTPPLGKPREGSLKIGVRTPGEQALGSSRTALTQFIRVQDGSELATIDRRTQNRRR